MFYLIPQELGSNPITNIFDLPEAMATFKAGLNICLILAVIISIILRKKQDKFLILTCMILGYPLNSSRYNLVILAIPLIYWLIKEHRRVGSFLIACLGAMEFACLGIGNVWEIAALNGQRITLHSLLSPIILATIIITIIVMRRKEFYIMVKRVKNHFALKRRKQDDLTTET